MTDEDPSGVDGAPFARWLDEHWDPDLTLGDWWERLGTAGWSTPTWPREWSGRGLGRAEAVQVVDALRRRGIPGGPTGVGVDMAGPTILARGDDEQRRRYVADTKCCELDLPLVMNAGLPGPPLPGDVQDPMHYDRVCVRFPELRLCLMHGADPWWDVAIRLMIKYANLRLMTSAWAPRHLPQTLLHFMSTRGTNRVMFASDSPVLSITRCIKEASALELTPEVLDAYLYQNAQDFFFTR